MAQGSFPQAGEFELLKAVILTSSAKSIDITPNVLHIAFFEDTTKHAISGNILFQNSFAATSWGPLVGQEFLQLRIKTQGFEDPETNINYTKNVLASQNLIKSGDLKLDETQRNEAIQFAINILKEDE